jgi:DNA-directed RNA polymerase subunit RPC12/RpoP
LGKEVSPIFDTAGAGPAGEALASGAMPGEGTYFCLVCGSHLALRETDPLPECPRCGASRFRRDSIFSSMQEHDALAAGFADAEEHDAPAWLEAALARLIEPGYHLAVRESGEISTFPLAPGWTRIGRCETAEICLDDPSVSRRHAMVACESGRPPRLLDDRSLEGVLVNGHRTEFAELQPGDEVAIGRFRLFLLQI